MLKKLSICIPTYDRKNELKKLLNMMPSLIMYDFEIVICDDGSTDTTKQLVEKYADQLPIKYLFQKNAGRSVALKNAILNAEGKYTILMDSDDYFTPSAFEHIFEVIEKLESDELSEDVNAALFGTKLIKDNNELINLPPNGISNFIAVRADLNVKKDLKEVVRTDILKSCIYDVPEGCRRVPTSLLWAKVAEQTRCLSVDKAIAVKEYLPGGMTDRILSLKTKYSKPMVELYSTLAESKTYDSVIYRWRSRILWARHAFHEGSTKPSKIWQFLVWPFGWFIYLNDKRKLARVGN